MIAVSGRWDHRSAPTNKPLIREGVLGDKTRRSRYLLPLLRKLHFVAFFVVVPIPRCAGSPNEQYLLPQHAEGGGGSDNQQQRSKKAAAAGHVAGRAALGIRLLGSTEETDGGLIAWTGSPTLL